MGRTPPTRGRKEPLFPPGPPDSGEPGKSRIASSTHGAGVRPPRAGGSVPRPPRLVLAVKAFFCYTVGGGGPVVDRFVSVCETVPFRLLKAPRRALSSPGDGLRPPPEAGFPGYDESCSALLTKGYYPAIMLILPFGGFFCPSGYRSPKLRCAPLYGAVLSVLGPVFKGSALWQAKN